jgi:hypothetical protein
VVTDPHGTPVHEAAKDWAGLGLSMDFRREPPLMRRTSLVSSTDNVTWSAELLFHGESVGWEAQILRDGDLAIGRTFVLRDIAIGWAENERDRLEGDDPFA